MCVASIALDAILTPDTELAPSLAPVTAPFKIFASVTESAPSLVLVTDPFAKCIASILPDTNSLESTVFAASFAPVTELAASSVAVTDPATIFVALTEFTASFASVT